ncbi:MAG: IS1634 family transposase [Desulfurivibrionaceae bacterium]
MKKGRPYYYVREIARVDGKPKVVNQIYLGSPERMAQMAAGGKQKEVAKIQAQEFGALWLADLIDADIDIAGLIDSVIPRSKQETGPSIGEYFLYEIMNRMVDSRSKRALPEWFSSTGIQQIRPVKVSALSSQRFWKKWDRVEAGQLEEIAALFFRRIAALEPDTSDCFMFDTTNYYTFMASDTESDLAKRGKNKEGRNWLRQVGVALLVSRDTRLPLYYREYEGNRHDSKVFARVMEELFSAMEAVGDDQAELTLVFDKGMNAEDNFAVIDAHPRIHFITTYSTYYAEKLIHVALQDFQAVETAANQRLREKGRGDDQLLAWRTTGEHWGRERTVVVTYNPRTATKQRYGFEKKLLRVQEELYVMRGKINAQERNWKNETQIRQRYADLCAEIHLPADLYAVELYHDKGRLRMTFRKNYYRIERYLDRLGKNIIITDHTTWTTDEIVRASLDRYAVENSFRQSKDDDLVNLMPVRHWTDSKIRCHIFACIVALTYLRRIELQLLRAGEKMSAKQVMDEMHRLHSCLVWKKGVRKPERIIEEPTEKQAAILKAFGYKIDKGVLQETRS